MLYHENMFKVFFNLLKKSLITIIITNLIMELFFFIFAVIFIVVDIKYKICLYNIFCLAAHPPEKQPF